MSEHAGQLVCSACLRASAAQQAAPLRRRAVRRMAFAALCPLALVAAWVFFYSAGQTLLASFAAPGAGR